VGRHRRRLGRLSAECSEQREDLRPGKWIRG
jgi:hypothetical protein